MTRLIQGLLLTLISLPACAEPAGRVLYAIGEARAESAAGVTRVLARGTAVESGDTLVTERGRLQVRFSDGGLVALQPKTRFAVEEYRYAGTSDRDERSFLALLRGSVRFVTGLIGKRDRADYRIRTPVATIGIRGSGGRADMCVAGSCGARPDGLYLVGNYDVLTLTNTLYDRDVRPGDTFYIKCDSCPIESVDVGPVAHQEIQLPAPQRTFERGEQRQENSEDLLALAGVEPPMPVVPPVVPPPVLVPLPSGSGGLVISYIGINDNPYAGLVGGTNTFNAAGALIQFRDGTFPTQGFDATSIRYFFADGVVAWGLWDGGTATPQQASPIGTSSLAAVSYVGSIYGTPAATLDAINGTYTVFASTPPVAVSGGTISSIGLPDSVTGSFNVNFSANTVGYALNIPLGGETFTMSGTATFVNPSPGSGDARILGGGTISSSGTGCSSSCMGTIPFGPDIQALVLGLNGERVGASYGFSSALGQVSGAVVAKP